MRLIITLICYFPPTGARLGPCDARVESVGLMLSHGPTAAQSGSVGEGSLLGLTFQLDKSPA